MSEQIETEELETPHEEPVQPTVDEAALEAQEEAKKYGWKPKEDFDLAPEGWVDADRFLELPSTQVKMQRDANKALQSQMESNSKDFAERLERIEAANKAAMQMALEAKEKEHKQQLADLTQRQREAVETGDIDTYDQIERQKSQIAPPVQPSQPQQVDIVAQYGEKYTWLSNPEIVNLGAAVLEQNPAYQSLPAEKQLAFVERKLRADMPDLFPDNPKPAKVVRTDPGGLGGRTPQRQLPPEAMAAAKEFVEEGLFKSIEDYAKAYWSQ